jgi:DNA-binding NtrC family response regulator
LGDTRVETIDVRIIASTNQNLKQKMAQKEFREDFFYRLSVISIELPPLRDRITDIPILCNALLAKQCEKMNKPPKALSEEVLDLFMKQPWTGNIRELENVLIHGILYSKADTITLSDIPVKDRNSQKRSGIGGRQFTALPYREAKERVLYEFNHDYIGTKLSMTQGNVTQAAKLCRMDRQALQQIMKRYGLDPEPFR